MNPELPQPGVRRQAPSCWAIGGISCAVLALLIVIAMFVAVGGALHSKVGKEIVGQMQKSISGATQAAACKQNLAEVNAALRRYHDKNGRFPADLTALVPQYLPDGGKLHCEMDPNPDPKHVTFVYHKSAAAPSDDLVGFTGDQVLTMQNQRMTTSYHWYYTVSGKAMSQRIMTDNTGRKTVMPPTEDVGG